MKPWLLLLSVLAAIASAWAAKFLITGVSAATYYPTVWALIYLGVAFWIGQELEKQGVGKFSVYLMAGIIGGAAGWLLGIYFFPRNSDEAARFQSIGTIVGSLLTGYLLKEFSDVWKFLSTPAKAGDPPPILLPPRREYGAFFLASLLISGGVQYGTRTLENVHFGWNGAVPSMGKDKDSSRYVIPALSQYRLAGAIDAGNNPAVRWALESSADPKGLQDAKQHGTTLDADSGILTAGQFDKSLYADVIESSVANPEIAKAIPIRFDPAPPAH